MRDKQERILAVYIRGPTKTGIGANNFLVDGKALYSFRRRPPLSLHAKGEAGPHLRASLLLQLPRGQKGK